MKIGLLVLLLLGNTFKVWPQLNYEVLVHNRANSSIQLYDASGNYIRDFISSGSGGLVFPEDILFLGDSIVLVTGFNNSSIKKYDAVSGAYVADFTYGYALSSPSKMSLGPDSLIYVTQWGNAQNKVVRFSLNGQFAGEFTSIGAPRGLGHVWDEQGNFYIALFGDGASGTVHKFDSLGNDLGVFINSNILQGPTDIWWDTNGDMLVEDWSVGKVLRYDSTGSYKGVFITGLTNPEGVAFTPDGKILIGDWGVDAVYQISLNGINLGYFASGNGLDNPNGVHIRPVTGVSLPEASSVTGNLTVLPTSGNGVFNILFNLGRTEVLSLEIIDPAGKCIDEIICGRISKGENTFRWSPPPSLPEGYYYVILRGDKALKKAPLYVHR